MKINSQRGFIGKIVLVIVAIVALKYYFHFDLLTYIKTPEAEKVIQPVWGAIKAVYQWVDGIVRGFVK